MTAKSYFLVLTLVPWKEMSVIHNGQPYDVTALHSGIGYCPIFDSFEEAKKEFPYSEITEISIGVTQ